METVTRRQSSAVRRAGWEVMRALKQFTAEDLIAGGMSANSARVLVRRLLADGDILQVGERSRGGIGNPNVYQLTLARHIMPRAVDPVRYWQVRAWNSMRIFRRFTALDILRTVRGVGYRPVRRFCADLEIAGILRASGRQMDNGAPGSHTVYVLSQDLGPEPPTPEDLREMRKEVKGYV